MKVSPLVTIAGAAGMACAATTARAQIVNASWSAPTLDRWMYPFNFSAGGESNAPTFGAITQPGFDDRDAQFVVGFDTSAQVVAGKPLDHYRLRHVRVTAFVSVDSQAQYDDTFDRVMSLYAISDPEYVTDTDAGRPVELFGVGYRNGFTAASFQENSPFGGSPIVPPAEGARNAFAAAFTPAGAATDVSRQVRERFDAVPFAIGLNTGLTPGQYMPAGTALTFDIDLCDESARAYVQRSLAAGKLMLAVSSLQPASGGPGGGTGSPSYPAFFTKENAVAIANGYQVKLDIELAVGTGADFDNNGFINGEDFDLFVDLFYLGDAGADWDGNCFVNGDDFDGFVLAFEGGV